jgi:hypothetical protein
MKKKEELNTCKFLAFVNEIIFLGLEVPLLLVRNNFSQPKQNPQT